MLIDTLTYRLRRAILHHEVIIEKAFILNVVILNGGNADAPSSNRHLT